MKLLRTLACVGTISMMTAGAISSPLSALAFNEAKPVERQNVMLISVSPNWQAKLPTVKDAISGEIAGHLKQFAHGNEKDAWVEALDIRGREVYVRAKIRHRQVAKKFGRKFIVYSLTQSIETSYDPLSPSDAVKKARLCFDNPPVVGGKSCASGSNVIAIINKFLI